MNLYQSIIEPVISIFLPALCIHCNNPLPTGRKVICASCFSQLLHIESEQIVRFKKKLSKQYFDEIFILYQFNPLFQELIHLLKYQHFLSIADYFGQSLAKALSETSYDYITAVPLNSVRYRERGYNQSALIADRCADCLQIEFVGDILVRKRNTKSQTKLSRSERVNNIADAFLLNKEVQDKDILIVDDVITTGSTLNECVKILKEGNAGKVDIAAISTPTNLLQLAIENEDENLDIF